MRLIRPRVLGVLGRTGCTRKGRQQLPSPAPSTWATAVGHGTSCHSSRNQLLPCVSDPCQDHTGEQRPKPRHWWFPWSTPSCSVSGQGLPLAFRSLTGWCVMNLWPGGCDQMTQSISSVAGRGGSVRTIKPELETDCLAFNFNQLLPRLLSDPGHVTQPLWTSLL